MPNIKRRDRGILGMLAIVFATTLGAALFAQTAARPTADPEVYVHPDLRRAAEAARQGRFLMPATTSPGAPAAVQRTVPGPKGAPDVRVSIVNDGGGGAATPRPAILHIHGGGYTGGSASIMLPSLQALAAALDCVIVSVDYRLAPGTRFPGSLEDNYAALKWLYGNARELGVDASRIAVMGESAGGGHAAMLAIAARDRGEVPLLYQALIYPMLDDRSGTTRQVPPQIGTLVWTRDANRGGWTALLGVPAGASQVPEGAVPARVANLAGLPPTFIGVGGIDLFVEEDIGYAQRLNNAGVPVELNVVPGAFHAFDVFEPNAPVTIRFRAALTNALKGAFAGAFRKP
jgi:acetyl esterase/lipase